MKEYWENFQAEEGYVNNQSESCGAKLIHFVEDDDDAHRIAGATGKCGHAEMHALWQFIRNVCKYDVDRLEDCIEWGLYIECPAKSCCVRCSIILGGLRFQSWPGSYVKKIYKTKRVKRSGKWRIQKTQIGTQNCYGETYKTEEKMGKTEWALHPDLRKFLAGYFELTEQDILNIGTLTGY
jgi:hypothetical protein